MQPTMGALMARRSVQTLVGEFVAAGGGFRPFAVDPPRSDAASLGSITGSGGKTLRAGRFVFACGPWLPKLFPEVVGDRIVTSRQDVFFFAPRSEELTSGLQSLIRISYADFCLKTKNINNRTN